MGGLLGCWDGDDNPNQEINQGRFSFAFCRNLTARETLENPAPTCAKIGLRMQVWTGLMGGKQLGFGDYEQTTTKKQTKREMFQVEMEAAHWGPDRPQ